MPEKKNGQSMTKVTWPILRGTDDRLNRESELRGLSKVALVRVLLDWSLDELSAGRVTLIKSVEGDEETAEIMRETTQGRAGFSGLAEVDSASVA